MMDAETNHFQIHVITGAYQIQCGRMQVGIYNWNYHLELQRESQLILLSAE